MLVPESTAAVAPGLLRAMNQRRLLQRLYDGGPATRPRLSQDCGMSQPTVFAALAALEHAGLVRPSGQSGPQPGRPALVFEADPDAAAALVVQVGAVAASVIVVDVSGRVRTRSEHPLPVRDAGPDTDAAPDALADDALPAGEELGDVEIACVVVAAADADGEADARVARWAERLRARFAVPVVVEDAVGLAALAEHREGSGRGSSPFAYLRLGGDPRVRIVVGGELLRGADGRAGRIGDLALARDLRMPEGAAPAPAAEPVAELLRTVAAFIDPEVIAIDGLSEPAVAELSGRSAHGSAAVRMSSLGDEAATRGALIRGVALARELAFRERLG